MSRVSLAGFPTNTALCLRPTLASRCSQFAIGRLGIFHLMKRITDRLRKQHPRVSKAMRSLSSKIFQFNQDDVKSVELELRAGNLGGKTHGDDEIRELHESGLFMKRYRRFIESKTFSPAVLERGLDEWYDENKDDYDEAVGEQLFYPDMRDRVNDAIGHVDDIYDVDGEHYTKRRKKPRQKHSLCEKVCDRGEKVEIFHSMQGDYSNSGCRATLAQAQTMEGAIMFTMDKMQEVRFHEHKVSSPTVLHYRPWLRLEANDLARRAGMTIPHPDEIAPLPDNGERFLFDYYLEQRVRETEADFSDEALERCPCRRCASAELGRLDCRSPFETPGWTSARPPARGGPQK